MIVWKEPFLNEYPHVMVTCSIEKDEAVEVQHFIAQMEDVEYETDMEALIDFMVVRDAIDTDGQVTIGSMSETTFIGH